MKTTIAIIAALLSAWGALVGIASEEAPPKTSGLIVRPAFRITTKKPEDRVKVQVNGGEALVDIACPSGIGSATLTLTEGKWPEAVVLRLHLSGLESLRVSNGKTTLSVSVLSHSGNPRTLQLIDDGKAKNVEPGSPYRTEIRAVNAEGKTVSGLPDKDGHFDIRLPKALLEGQPKSITISWIDFFRG